MLFSKRIFPLIFLCILLLFTSCSKSIDLKNENALPATKTPEIEPASPTPARFRSPTFNWQLTDYPIDYTLDADYFGLDLFEISASTIAAIHERNAQVICYLNAGAWEEFRPDADEFPDEVIGRKYAGWPGERWLDIHNYEVFAPIMLARMDLAVEKGCDGIEPDNIQGYQEKTGFPITAADQLAYNRWLSEQAQARGLLIALKNDPDQVPDLVDVFDLAIVEDCAAFDFCEVFQLFIEGGKPVFQVEYTDQFDSLDAFCGESLSYSAQLKHRELDAWSLLCP